MTSWVEEEEKEFTGGEESKDVLLETQVERPDDGRLRSTGSTASLRSVASTSRSGRDLGKAEAAGASDSIGESSMTLDGSVENKEAEGEGEGEVSRRRKRMRLGGSAGARVALGLRDGSVWIFGHGNGDQADAAAHQEPSLTTTSAPDISTLATPRRERSSSRATIGSGLSVRRGAVSPNDGRRDSVVSQAHSTNTQTHRGSSASQLPFAGFPHAATSPTTSTSHAIASPTSRFDDGDQWSIAAGASAHGDVHSPPMRAEEELESQANRAENHGVVGGMMEALGFGTGHSHHHGKHATAGGDATAGTGSARLTSPALPRTHSHSRSNARGSVVIPPSETGSSSLPTPTSASRKSVPSSTGKDQTGATRGSSSRDTPNEGSASFGAMGAALAGAGNLGSLGIGGGQRAAGGPDVALEDSRRRVPAAGSGSGSGSMGRFEARERGNSPGIDTDTLLGDTTVPVARLDGDGGLREMRPLVQLVTADRSPVVDVRLVEQGAGDRALIVLQEGGQLSTWSLQDGTCQSHLNLSHTQAYPPPAQAESHNLAPAHATSGPFATLASLRSHANSPAPSLRSRSGSNAGLKAPAGAQERKGKVHVEFEELQIVNEAEVSLRLRLRSGWGIPSAKAIADADHFIRASEHVCGVF